MHPVLSIHFQIVIITLETYLLSGLFRWQEDKQEQSDNDRKMESVTQMADLKYQAVKDITRSKFSFLLSLSHTHVFSSMSK